MEKVNLAILGFGFMGKVYSLAADSVNHFFPTTPKVKIKHVLVSQRANKKKIEDRYDFHNVTHNFEDIIQDNDTQAIYVALPNDLHSEYVCKGMSNGKHILCDKPLETNYAKAKAMNDLAKQNPHLIAQTVFEYRFIPAIGSIKKIIENGELGRILQFRIMYLHGSYAENRPLTWRLREGIGGVLRDLGPHVIDLSNYLLGPLKTYNGKISKKYPSREVEDIAYILCESQSGADGYMEVSRLAVGSVDDLRLEIHGELGAVRWNLENLNFFEFFSKASPKLGFQKVPSFTNPEDDTDFPPEKVSSDWLRPHVHCLYNFVKDIEGLDRSNGVSASFEDALYVQKIIDDILKGG